MERILVCKTSRILKRCRLNNQGSIKNESRVKTYFSQFSKEHSRKKFGVSVETKKKMFQKKYESSAICQNHSHS